MERELPRTHARVLAQKKPRSGDVGVISAAMNESVREALRAPFPWFGGKRRVAELTKTSTPSTCQIPGKWCAGKHMAGIAEPNAPLRIAIKKEFGGSSWAGGVAPEAPVRRTQDLNDTPIMRFVERVGGCGGVTTMGRALSETYARDPKFYGATFCVTCNAHYPVDQFVWTADNQVVGS